MDTMVDAHEALHGCDDYPHLAHMTNHRQGMDGMRIHSKIDYSLISESLVNRLSSCEVDDSPCTWSKDGSKRAHYHSALVTTLDWEGLWSSEDTNTSKEIPQGSTLPLGPNYARRTKDHEVTIARAIDTNIGKHLKAYGSIRYGRGSPLSKATELIAHLKTTLVREAKNVLGTAPAPKATTSTSLRVAEAKWDRIVVYAKSILGKRDHRLSPPPPVSPSEISCLRSFFKKKKVALPDCKAGWTEWWRQRDQHRVDAIVAHQDITLSDTMARGNPKSFNRRVSKPFATTAIPSLRVKGSVIATESGIAKELTSFLSTIAAADPNDPGPPGADEEYIEDPHMTDVLNPISERDVITYATSLDSGSGCGKDTISPWLLKSALTSSWLALAPTTDIHKKEHVSNILFNEEYAARRLKLGLKNRETPSDLGDESPDTRRVTRTPDSTVTLVMWIFNLCLKAKDVPSDEKLTVVTGLPKRGGRIHSTTLLRPISVGQVLNRFFNKILAGRLAGLFVRHKKMDPAQFAFLPDHDIHEPINTSVECFRDRQLHDKPCFAIYYDISKAYDSIRWSSIERGLRRMGMPQDFISLVMNSLEGTKLMMRTSVRGRVTPMVQLKKAIKQGCPLAPLLFTIVMDELHCNLRSFDGYTLGDNFGPKGPVVHSRGYCDDTFIISHNLQDLDMMNNEVCRFFTAHGLKINEKKSKVTGRWSSAEAFTGHLCWPATGKALGSLAPKASIRYLGLLVSMDLLWKDQISHMNSKVMSLVSSLGSNRLTVYQAALLVQYVINSRLEPGLRHADIPHSTLISWDRWIAAAITVRAGLSGASLLPQAVAAIGRITPLFSAYRSSKMTHLMEMLTQPSELSTYYQNIYFPLIEQIEALAGHEAGTANNATSNLSRFDPKSTHHPAMAAALCSLAREGTRLKANPDSCCRSREGVEPKPPSGITSAPMACTFRGIPIPVRRSYNLWTNSSDKSLMVAHSASSPHSSRTSRSLAAKSCVLLNGHYHSDYCPNPAMHPGATAATLGDAAQQGCTRATCCTTDWCKSDQIADRAIRPIVGTDGSTYEGIPSGAALVYGEDGAKSKRLWGHQGYYWSITKSNNHMAEMAAINVAIRSVPIELSLRIYTDSLSSIQSIRKALKNPTGFRPLRCAARPYLMAIVRAIMAKRAQGASVEILHVRSHQNGTDLASICNAEADRLAKYEALTPNSQPDDIDLLANELPVILTFNQWTISNGIEAETQKHEHGDIRKAINKHLQSLAMSTWADISIRPTRGELAHEDSKEVNKTIMRMWANKPDSTTIKLLLEALNRVSDKGFIEGSMVTVQCDRCNTGAEATVEHLLQCPSNEDIWNKVDTDVADALGISLSQDSCSCTSLTEDVKLVAQNIAAALGDLPNVSSKNGNIRVKRPGSRVSTALHIDQDLGRISALAITTLSCPALGKAPTKPPPVRPGRSKPKKRPKHIKQIKGQSCLTDFMAPRKRQRSQPPTSTAKTTTTSTLTSTTTTATSTTAPIMRTGLGKIHSKVSPQKSNLLAHMMDLISCMGTAGRADDVMT